MIWAGNFVRIFLPYKNVTNGNIDEFAGEQVRQLIDAIHAQGAKCGTQTDIMGSAFYGEVPACGGRDVQYFTLGERLHGGFLRGEPAHALGASRAARHAVPRRSALRHPRRHRIRQLRRPGSPSCAAADAPHCVVFALCRFPRCPQRRCGRISDADFLALGASCVMCRPCHAVRNAPAPRYSRAVWCPLCTKQALCATTFAKTVSEGLFGAFEWVGDAPFGATASEMPWLERCAWGRFFWRKHQRGLLRQIFQGCCRKRAVWCFCGNTVSVMSRVSGLSAESCSGTGGHGGADRDGVDGGASWGCPEREGVS